METLQEKLFKIVSTKHDSEALRGWKSHVVLFRRGEESGYALCHEHRLEDVYGFLQKEKAEYVHCYELGRTVYTRGL